MTYLCRFGGIGFGRRIKIARAQVWPGTLRVCVYVNQSIKVAGVSGLSVGPMCRAGSTSYLGRATKAAID